MRILVTGGSSFVGAWVSLLAARDHTVYALHRRTPLRLNGVTPVRGDLLAPSSLRRLQVDLIVHLAARIKVPGGDDPAQAAAAQNRAMMDTVLGMGRPVVYASSTAVHWPSPPPYAVARQQDERALADSGLPYAIIRPCAPYGPPVPGHQPRHRESFQTLADLVRRLPVVPVVGDGRYLRQPVHVHDFAAGVLALASDPQGQVVDAGGADALSMNQIIAAIAKRAGRRVWPLHLPKGLFVAAARLAPDFDPSLIAAMDTDDVADPAAFTAATGVAPRPFSRGVGDLL